MKRLFMLVALGASLLAHPLAFGQGVPPTATQAQINGIQWAKSYADAVELSQNSSKPILILFTGTNWCPACMKLEREVLKNSEFTDAVGQEFVFLKAEFPDHSEQAMKSSPFKPLFDRYKIEVFPTIIVVDAQGEKLFAVNYQRAGAQAYIQELLVKLQHLPRKQ